MSAPKEGAVREAAVAGQFYPSDPNECRQQARQLLSEHEVEAASVSGNRLLGSIVPHAGWICSGAVAGCSVRAMQLSGANPDVIVVFGAVHTAIGLSQAALDSSVTWNEPTGGMPVDAEVRDRLSRLPAGFVTDERFHRNEHAVEVELPLVQQAFAGAMLLPLEVPLVDDAVRIGIETACAVRQSGRSAVFLASSDLTHYGPAYGFAPVGIGLHGLKWARDNDRRLLECVARFEPEAVVRHVRTHQNACGGGAIAAMLAACREFGASQAVVLRHTDSYEVLSRFGRDDPANSVGYASVVVR